MTTRKKSNVGDDSVKKHIKIVVVGDGAVGKTCLLLRYSQKRFNPKHIPTVCDNYNIKTDLEGAEISVDLWDTAGQEDYDRLRCLSYRSTDVFIVCFAINSLDSLDRVQYKWVPEIQHYSPGVPFLLVGNKVDLRPDSHNNVSKQADYISRNIADLEQSIKLNEDEKNKAAKIEDFRTAQALKNRIDEDLQNLEALRNSLKELEQREESEEEIDCCPEKFREILENLQGDAQGELDFEYDRFCTKCGARRAMCEHHCLPVLYCEECSTKFEDPDPDGSKPKPEFVSTKFGKKMGKRVKALKYFECSALSGEMVTTIFEHAVKFGVKTTKRKRKECVVL